jgi:hypothetical protein
LVAAEQAGFDLLLTTNGRIKYQLNLCSRQIALVVLTGSTKWSQVRRHADRVAVAVTSATPGNYAEVEIPFEPKPRCPYLRDASAAANIRLLMRLRIVTADGGGQSWAHSRR